MGTGNRITWGLALGAIALVGLGSAALVREQWRADLAAAQRAGTTSLAQLAPLVEDELQSARYADVPEIIDTWGSADPTLARIRIEARSGFVIGEFARAGAAGAEHLEFEAPVIYGYGGHARVLLTMDLSGAVAARNRLTAQLGAANLVIDAAIIAVAYLLVMNRRAVRRYRTVSAVNQALISGQDTQAFLGTICEAAVNEGGYALAWIGLFGDDPSLATAAVAGPAAAYAGSLHLTADPAQPDGRGPAGIALREKRPVWTNDFERDPLTAPWAERARACGIRASAALPLCAGERVIGLLGLYSTDPGHFDADERALTLQMAGDIALGIEHQRRGQQVEHSRAQLRTTLDGLQVFVALIETDGTIIEVNRAALSAAGLRSEDVVGVPLADSFGFSHAPDAQVGAGAAVRRAAAGEILRYDDVLRVAGNQRLTVDLTLAPLRGADGRVTHIVVSGVDISARKQLEQQHFAESERNRLFLRNASDGVHILDAAGRVVEVSDSFCALLGYGAHELIGKHPGFWDQLLPGAEIEALLARLAAGERLRFETVHRRKDGTSVDVELLCSGFQIHGQQYNFCSARDLTEVRRLQRELLGAVASEQRRLGQELHDGLGQELTGATLIARALTTRAERSALPLAGELKELTDMIARCISSARRIVRGLSPLTDVNGDLAAGLIELVGASSGGGIEVRFTGDPRAAVTVGEEARGHLFRIAQEAVQNALKHAGARRIEVHLEADASELRLTVSDDGVGLDATLPDGAGYGMRTMRYRAAAIRGRLTIHPRPGGGTVVACVVPQTGPEA